MEYLGAFIAERQNLQNSLFRLTSMADSIKRADLESVVQPNTTNLDLTDVISNIRVKAEASAITATFSGKTITNISIDAAKVDRVVANLANNAIEAASTAIDVTWYEDNTNLVIQVSDDGAGIDG